jgi:hypothetical protein
MATVPIDLALNVVVGSSVALAGYATADQYKVLRSPALWTLVIFEMLVFLPIGVYLLARFPAWSIMYLFEPAALPIPAPYLAVLYPIVAIAVFVVCHRLIVRARTRVALAVLAAGFILSILVFMLGSEQLVVLGTTAEYRTDVTQMRATVDSPLAYVAWGAGVAVAVGWGATAWRLWLLGRAMGTRAVQTTVPDDRPPAKRKAKRTRKKT